MAVDDIRLTTEGDEEHVAAVLPAVAESAVRIIEGRLNMQVSRDDGAIEGQTVAQVSSQRLGKWFGPRLKRLGVKAAAKVKNLGVQFAVGSKRLLRNQVAKGRFEEG